jgi:hypothetical protein
MLTQLVTDSREPDTAVLFDLDGVLAQTANVHVFEKP